MRKRICKLTTKKKKTFHLMDFDSSVQFINRKAKTFKHKLVVREEDKQTTKNEIVLKSALFTLPCVSVSWYFFFSFFLRAADFT